VLDSVSLAIRSARLSALAESSPVGNALIAELGAFRLITPGGPVTSKRRLTSGFARGSLVVEEASASPDTDRLVRLELQNENLVGPGARRVLRLVPDLITVLDSDTADAIYDPIRFLRRPRVHGEAFACDPIVADPRTVFRSRARARSLRVRLLPARSFG